MFSIGLQPDATARAKTTSYAFLSNAMPQSHEGLMQLRLLALIAVTLRGSDRGDLTRPTSNEPNKVPLSGCSSRDHVRALSRQLVEQLATVAARGQRVAVGGQAATGAIAKQDFSTGFVRVIDWLFGRVDDELALWSIERARDAAWENTQHLWNLRASPAEQQNHMDIVDGFVGFAGRGVLRPLYVLSSFSQLSLLSHRVRSAATTSSAVRPRPD